MSAHHRHAPNGAPKFYCFSGPVAVPENRKAHGGVCEVATCACGAVRKRNLNGLHVESSGWETPVTVVEKEAGVA